MSGHSNVEGQVAEFFAERGLLPIVPVRYRPGRDHPRVHAAYPATPFTPLCTRALRRGSVMRSASGKDLTAPPCRGCTRQHIYHRRVALTAAGHDLVECGP